MNNYYISTTGNDNNSGISKENAYASLLKAAEVVKPGDTVYILGGIYEISEKLYMLLEGTKDQPITFKAYDDTIPVFDFSKVTDSHPKEFVINILPGSSFVVFDGLEICNSPISGIIMMNCSDITIKNCKVHHIAQFGISIRSDNCVIENNEVYQIAKGWEECFRIGSHPQVLNTYFKPPVPPATVGSYAYNNVFRGNHIYECWGEGIDPIFGDGIIVENNIIRDVHSVGVYLDSTRNIVIRNNYIFSTDDSHNLEGRDNRRLAGIGMGCEYFGCWSDNAPISHNENIQIYNNVISGVGTGFMQWYDHLNSDYQNTYKGVKIYNNTVDTYGDDGDAIGYAVELPIMSTGNECKNNILQGKREISINEESFIFENNLWVNDIPVLGKHVNSFTGDPGWENAVMSGPVDGYKLKADSVCIGAGVPVKGLETDKTGKQRNNPPCLGAFEAKFTQKLPTMEETSFIYDVIPQPIPNFHVGINVIKNPSFEDEGCTTINPPKDWSIEGQDGTAFVYEDGYKGIYDNLHHRFIVGNGPDRDPMNPINDSRYCMKLGTRESYKVYAYQCAENIDNGRYGLHARIKRFGEQGAFFVEAKDFGNKTLSYNIPTIKELNSPHVDLDQKWFQINISDIVVTNGQCTIGFYAEGDSDNYLLIDEVWLYRY